MILSVMASFDGRLLACTFDLGSSRVVKRLL